MGARHDLTVTVDADPRAEPESDEVRILLFRSASELLFNVVKHAGVTVAHVVLRPGPDDTLVMAVSDAGRGAELSDGQRTSLGLFTIETRVESLGGAMMVDSGPGAGTRVTITAPRSLVAATEPRPPEEVPVLGAGHGPDGPVRLLLVDDHTILREGVAGLLEDAGFVVAAQATEGQRAVELAEAIRPDVVVMDVSLPDMSGMEATRRILDRVPETRVVALSMHDDEAIATGMLNAGALAYVRKDSPLHDLVGAIFEVSAGVRP
jgi:CheY-like chemotaxis protein